MVSDFNEKLALYYKKSFPYQLIYNWLKYDKESLWKMREFSFTLPGDIYVRYQSFENEIDFRSHLVQRIPIKIDVGAIYNLCPKFYRTNPNDFRPLQHELVFDIDISDYDDVRNCCSESKICNKCWPFMRIGAKILNTILTKEFGFKHLLFVFSGRRGFHCWVCDKVARDLPADARKAITDYFSVVVGGQAMVKRVSLNPFNGIHPMLCKSLKVIEQEFDDLMLVKQDFLSTENLVQSMIDLCEDKTLQDRISEVCKHQRLTSTTCWEKIKILTSANKNKKTKYFIEEVMLQHCFPRLDANVTRGLNHLLKLPFCIHPKTGNVCVPISIDDIDSFDIEKVPNLANLTAESLDPFIKIMKRFVDGLNE